ncbi:tetratricopeptide repeat protein [Longimicrobium sp.]|uniref:tetratricopeptide repeat protein n=1 Tax=Longimicrobium sp. TaxID=2029185 RepID=UPI002E311A25|nr:tetratricopeptide repeat protein [Longimicrobium sp.]HEX6037275.1 tetratricopeptide repeat protein [Longimicrobium sp.]
MPRLATALALVTAFLLAACAGVRRTPPTVAGEPEAISLLGAPLFSPEPPPAARAPLDSALTAAYAVYQRDPENADAIIWLGRRVAYLGRYRDAIDIFTEGVRKHPDDPRMYRHRGHRYITIRRFDAAAADLQRAAVLMAGRPDEVEPDGAPNARNIPLTTLHWNVWYHLGLARYLQGDFGRAVYAFRNALTVSRNDDSRVAATHWLYISLRRAGRAEEAASVLEPIREQMDIIENEPYHRLLLMYKGLVTPDSLLEINGTTVSTYGYGVGNWFLYNGQPERAEEIFWRVTSAENWTPFGYIAAEADLRRIIRRR